MSDVEFSEAMVPELRAMLLATVLPIDTLEPWSTDVSMAGVTTLLVLVVSALWATMAPDRAGREVVEVGVSGGGSSDGGRRHEDGGQTGGRNRGGVVGGGLGERRGRERDVALGAGRGGGRRRRRPRHARRRRGETVSTLPTVPRATLDRLDALVATRMSPLAYTLLPVPPESGDGVRGLHGGRGQRRELAGPRGGGADRGGLWSA